MPNFQNDPNQSADPDALGALGADLKEAGLQADTFVRSATNTATFGLANNAEAAAAATFGMGGPGDWGQRYQAELNQQKQRDVYDSIHRALAQRLGEVGGIGLGFLGGAESGVAWSDGLPSVAKGKLGEALSAMKSFVDANPVMESQVVKKLSRGFTRADFLRGDGTYLEAKFGAKARLQPRQIQAVHELGPEYQVERWLPKHVGYGAGGVAGAVALAGAAHNRQPHRVQPPVAGGRP